MVSVNWGQALLCSFWSVVHSCYMQNNHSHDQTGHDTNSDTSRLVATGVSTSPDNREDTNKNALNQANYTMTIQEAHAEFEKAALPISERTASRYCEKGKLDCLKIDPDSREVTDGKHFNYVVNPASLSKQLERMREKRELENRRSDIASHVETPTAPPHDMSSYDKPSHDTSEPVQQLNEDFIKMTEPDTVEVVSEVFITPLKNENLEAKLVEATTKIAALETSLLNERIEKSAAYQVRDEVIKQSSALVDKLSDSQYKLGGAEVQLRALGTPQKYGSEANSDDQKKKSLTERFNPFF